jgi:hypothetical protein
MEQTELTGPAEVLDRFGTNLISEHCGQNSLNKSKISDDIRSATNSVCGMGIFTSRDQGAEP